VQGRLTCLAIGITPYVYSSHVLNSQALQLLLRKSPLLLCLPLPPSYKLQLFSKRLESSSHRGLLAYLHRACCVEGYARLGESIGCFGDFLAKGACASLVPREVEGEALFKGVALGGGGGERGLEGL
jgi:hypothetical protein